jgi:ribosomal protein S18 acetylase RimI-like enzyme
MCQMMITLVPPSVAATEQFFRETSPRSRRNRFHGAVSQLPKAEVDGLTEVRDDRVNVYGFDKDTGEVLGVASAVFWSADVAEVSVWVVDRCQRHGLGTALTCTLRSRLAAAGVARVHAYIETSNTAALALWARVFPHDPAPNSRLDSEVWVSAELAPTLTVAPVPSAGAARDLGRE